MNELFKIKHPSTAIPTKTLSVPTKTFSDHKSINQLKSKVKNKIISFL
jgi:hypothetical protein